MTSPTIDSDTRDLAQRLSLMHAALTADAAQQREASDPTGALTVLLTGDHIDGIRLTADWKSKISPDSLGGAILTTNADAMIGRWSTMITAARRVGPQPTTPKTRPRPMRTPLSIAASQRERASELNHQLRSLIRRPAPPLEPVVVTDTYNHVAISIVQQHVKRITIEPRWARQAQRQRLCDTVAATLASAYAASPMVELDADWRRLTDDLAALQSEATDFEAADFEAAR